MNDKIKELAMRSGLGEHLWLNNSDPTEEEAVQKFAELIVNCCKQTVRDTYLPILEDKNMMKDKYWKGYVVSGVDAVCEINLIFGIDE